MEIPRLDSIQDISVMYETGDLPVLVLCSDRQQYICKYMRLNATIAYKLISFSPIQSIDKSQTNIDGEWLYKNYVYNAATA